MNQRSRNGARAHAGLVQSAARAVPRVSVCKACGGRVRYLVQPTRALWVHVEPGCRADANTTVDRTQIRDEV